MPSSPTVADLIQAAIQAENVMEELYRRLKRMFAHVDVMAHFLERSAAEESGHAVWLENLRKSLSPEKLATPAVLLVYDDAFRMSQTPIEARLESIETLDDAYRLIHDMEEGETHQVLDFLITTYYADENTKVFLRDHLRGHIERISMEFPSDYATSEARRAVKAMRKENTDPG